MTLLDKIKRWIRRTVAGLLIGLTIPAIALAYDNIEIKSLFKLVGTAIQPIVSTWTLGSSSDRITAGYFTDLDVTNMSASSVTISGAVTGNLLPDSNNARDIGSAALSWKNIYASGTANLANVIWTSATGTNTTSTNLFATNFQATNVLSNLVATPNNTYDLGSSALSWKDIYASGTARLENVTSTNVTTTNLFVTNVRSNLMPGTSNTYDIGSASLYFGNIVGNSLSGISQIVTPRIVKGGSSEGIIFDAGSVSIMSDSAVQRWRFDSTGFWPLQHNSLDIGMAASSVRNIYASGTVVGAKAIFGASTSTAMETGNIMPISNAIYSLGSTTKYFNVVNAGTFAAQAQVVTPKIIRGGASEGVIFNAASVDIMSDTATARWRFNSGGLFPLQHNLLDLGTSVSSVRNIYASGTVITVNVTTTLFSATGLPAAVAGATNPLCLDASGNGSIGASQICPLSSLASKTHLRPISYGLDELLKTNFYDFELKQDDGRTHSGVVADYLSKTMPNLVMYEDGKVNGYDVFSMVGVLGQSIKDLNAKVEGQQRKIDSLESRLLKLERKK